MGALEGSNLYREISLIIEKSKTSLKQSINTEIIETYWTIGKLIVEDEQDGSKRAEYGKEVLKTLGQELSNEFGKGFDVTNLRKMRLFYQHFSIRDALRLELSWTHYRSILRVEDKDETLVKYSMLNDSEQLFASKYKLYIPTEEELKQELNREISLLKERGVTYNG